MYSDRYTIVHLHAFFLALTLFFVGIETHAAPKVVTNESGAYPSFTLAPSLGLSEVLLMNMSGEIQHRWKIKTVRAKLQPSCNLLAITDDKLREYSWDGEIVWEVEAPKMIHHDFQRLSNGNTIFVFRKQLTYLPEKDAKEPDKPRKVRSDIIREVDKDGKTLWDWHFDKHLDFKSCGAKPCGRDANSAFWINKVRDWSHANTVRVIPENQWFDQGDKRFKPGNIITTARSTWSSYIIDKDTKEVVWTYSGDFMGGLRFPHEAHMIPKNLPGAGNILIFDNGDSKRGSITLEINPVTEEVIWHYHKGRKFFSNGHASLMRLSNGNTLVSEDFRNRAFELTPENKTVWKIKDIPGLRRAVKYPPSYCEKLKALPLN